MTVLSILCKKDTIVIKCQRSRDDNILYKIDFFCEMTQVNLVFKLELFNVIYSKSAVRLFVTYLQDLL